jgi:APA family basic amino acid/polyamine antiporter
VRSTGGIRFGDEHPAVHAVFILFGSKDMRNLHLRALAAIAQVVQQPSFGKRWMKGKHHRDLQDLLLLSKRHRK